VVKTDDANKIFYFVDKNNIPEELQDRFNWDSFSAEIRDGELYQKVYLGYQEARMMREEKLFQNVGDRIEDFFGNRMIIADIFPETGTVLDNLYFVKVSAPISDC